MSGKRITVMVHHEGSRYLERDILCRSTNELLTEIQNRFGKRLRRVNFFNPFVGSYQPLTSEDFKTLPRNTELKVQFQDDKKARIVDGSGHGGPGSPQMSHHNTLPYKSRVIEHLRKLLLPLSTSHMLSREDMITACSEICTNFLDQSGLPDEEIHSYKREVSLNEQDVLRNMVRQYKEAMFPEYEYIPHQTNNMMERFDHGQGSPRRPPSSSAGARATSATPSIGSGAVTSPVVIGSASQSIAAPPSDAAGIQPYNRVSTEDLFPASSPPAAVVAADNSNNKSPQRNNSSYLRNPSDLIYESPSRQRTRQNSEVREEDLPSNSQFQSVTYTVAGTMPNPPVQMDGAQKTNNVLRCTLSCPPTVDPDQDVILTGHIQSNSVVSLCWWLAYGPQRIVLNMDKMYVANMITTYQVSDHAFILAFRAGTLVPGWDYFVHLTATSGIGATSEAQVSFSIPAPTGYQMPRDGSYTIPGLRNRPFRRARNDGYGGDTEPGKLKEKAIAASIADDKSEKASTVGSVAPSVKSVPGGRNTSRRLSDSSGTTGTTGTKSKVSELVAAAKGAKEGRRNSGTPNEVSQSDSPAAALQSESTFIADVPRGTFQDQLRIFFTRQIEPLYYLSSTPSMTEQEFKTTVKSIAKRHWFRHPADHSLDDETKRDIVREIKQAITRR